MGNACCAKKEKSTQLEQSNTLNSSMKAGSFVPSMANFKNLRKINEINDFYSIGNFIN